MNREPAATERIGGGPPLDETHAPARRSWVASANQAGTDFPPQNLPFGVFRGGTETPRIGVAIGERLLDLHAAAESGLLECPAGTLAACTQATLNAVMALDPGARLALRRAISALLEEHHPVARDAGLQARIVPDRHEVRLLLPATIGDFTDFYASLDHAANVGALFRPEAPLLPNYKWIPIGYHGRASSVVPSGTPVRRPAGQTKPVDGPQPGFGPSHQLDYELELGVWVAQDNPQGVPVAMAQAESRLFGVSLLNDWSARDVQAWEYQPLGPFLAKDFATTVSPWVVTMEALAPFRLPALARAAGDPEPLPHLDSAWNRAHGGLAIELEALILTPKMREQGLAPERLGRTTFGRMYWTPAQLLAHHASNGCNLRPGDLLGSGTVSGPGPTERGCLLELTRGGTEPLALPTGETRRFLEDGDEVVMRGWCERPGRARIGLGECRGTVVA